MYVGHLDLVKRGIALSDRQLRRLEAQGQFPGRVKLSRSRIVWIESEVDQWERERNAARAAA